MELAKYPVVKKLNEEFMLSNYIRIAFRNIMRNKVYSFINIVGLSIGMAACLLILSYIRDDLRWDSFHENSDNIYRLIRTQTFENGETDHSAFLYPAIAPAMIQDIPEVKNAVRMSWGHTFRLEKDELKITNEDARYVDESFFDVFSFQLKYGNRESALDRPENILLSQSVALQIFGDKNPVGESLVLRDQNDSARTFQVAGVLEKPEEGSHFECDVILPMSAFPNEDPQMNLQRWEWFWFFMTYIELEDGVDHNLVQAGFDNFVKKYTPSPTESYYLQPLNDVHLGSGHLAQDPINVNSTNKTRLFSIGAIALIIIVIASINFVNLCTAQSMRRSREVGLRKVVGASRKSLVFQFIGESLFFSVISMLTAMSIFEFVKPAFANLCGREIYSTLLDGAFMTESVILLTLMVGVLSGLYPAFVLASFQPAAAIKDLKDTGRQASWVRRGLVIFQFTISISLLICTTLIFSQMKYTNSKDLGFDKEQILSIITPIPFWNGHQSVKDQLSGVDGINSICTSSTVPGFITGDSKIRPEGSNEDWTVKSFGIDEDGLETLKLSLADGRFFSKEFPSDWVTEEGSCAVILNETAVKSLGWENPIGRTIDHTIMGRVIKMEVVGVVKDFHFDSLHKPIEPLIMTCNINHHYNSLFSMRFETDNIQKMVADLETVWSEFFPNQEMQYLFLDEMLQEAYTTEMQSERMLQVFTALAIFIALLGTIGLVTHSIQRRTKEIGVRKVLGATVGQIVGLLSKDTLILILISNVIAWPLSWYLMSRWLENFAYKAPMNLLLFPLAGILAMLVALIAITILSIRAASMDPAKALHCD
jgi:putative ABC transport system permease protein